jgi:hypothetical protein
MEMGLRCKLLGHKWNGCKCESCGELRDEGHKFEPIGGKCEQKCSMCAKTRNVAHQWLGNKCVLCGSVNPVPSTSDWYALADKLAHFITLGMDESEADRMEEILLSGGKDVLTVILTYLLHCGQGKQSQGWWNNAKRLVRLIRRFPNEDYINILTQLVNFQCNIWEFQTQVKNVAQEQITALQEPTAKPDPPAKIKMVSKSSAKKIDRSMSPETKERIKSQEILKEYKCKYYGLRIYVTDEGVVLPGNYFIPFNDIREVILLPILEKGPAMGGCLKFVTDDNPELPIRDWHSFHMPGQSDAQGGYLGKENCFWFNCGYVQECAKFNREVEEIKVFIESKINPVT